MAFDAQVGGFQKPRPFVAIVIQARSGGSRFPGKVMSRLGPEPVLWWVLQRCAQSRLKHAVVVATPDKRISDYANSLGAWSYWDRGDENDVLKRYVKAAHFAGADVVARVTADCPLIDPKIIDMAISALTYEDMVSTVLSRNQEGRRTPKGLDVEVATSDCLNKLDEKVTDPRNREHVLQFIYENPETFYIKDLAYPPNDERIDWVVDTREDLDRLTFYLKGCMGEALYMNYKELLSGPMATFSRAWSPSRGDSEVDGGSFPGRSEADEGADRRRGA